MVRKNCYFSNGSCDGNCSKCAGANFAYLILQKAKEEEEERNKRYAKLLNK